MTNAYRFLRYVYQDNLLRAESERRNIGKDLFYYARNRALLPLESTLRHRYRGGHYPTVFIVGVPRSGTTLLYQLIARFLRVGYITNRMARYWMTPIAGAVLSGEVDRSQIQFASSYGAAKGPMAPHEFSWFWQHYGCTADHDHQDEQSLRKMEWSNISSSLSGLAEYWQMPLVLKSLNYVDYHIPWIARQMPQSRFIWMQRDDVATAHSILKVRRDRYGDRSIWWSVRPHDFHEWTDRAPEDQVAHQIHDIKDSIRESFSSLDPNTTLTTSYETLTSSPAKVLSALSSFLGASIIDGDELERLQLKPNGTRIDLQLEQRIVSALGARA
jgi:hypothetical protein